MPGVVIGEPVRSNGVGVVVETNNPQEYPLGRAFMHLTGWQQYCVVQSNPFPPITMVPEAVKLHDVLGVLGHIGITAYVGVLEVAKPQPGETFLVSAAASSVGSIAGQIAKMQGAQVIGIAGRPRSARGSSTSSASTRASTTRPRTSRRGSRSSRRKGVDVFFDNVGGDLARHRAAPARVARAASCCAATSRRTTPTTPAPPLHNLRYLMGKRARMEGFNTLDHWDEYEAAAAQLAAWVGRRQAQVPRRHARRHRSRARSVGALVLGRPPRQARRAGRRRNQPGVSS